MEKQPLPLPSTSSPPAKRSYSLLSFLLVLASLAAISWQAAQFALELPLHPCSGSFASKGLDWTACGDGLLCSRFAVPLDWSNSTDDRTISLSVLKWSGSNQKDKLGSLYINPGGPGGSGVGFVRSSGAFFDKLLKGRYDLIGWDPRGVSNTSDHVSCFDSALEQHLYMLNAPNALDLPANFSSLGPSGYSNPEGVVEDLEAQVRLAEASSSAVYQRCLGRTGEQLAFVGTQSVVRDLDALAKANDGEEARLNYWGMSYGTIVGQYMTQLLPASRLGKILLDGVVNATMWNTDVDHTHPFSGLQDISLVHKSFATSCAAAGPSCALSHLGSADAILAAISNLMDSLYHSPVPLPELAAAPGMVARAHHVKKALFAPGAYAVKEWPGLAERLDKALKGDLVDLVNATLPKLDGSFGEAALRPDTSGSYATVAIRCADAFPNVNASAHTNAQDVLTSLARNSPLVGNEFYELGFCHAWPIKSKSYYGGGFKLEDEHLDTPVLITNQRHDPVTPLGAAELALENYGGNARLLQQNGDGHCVIGQASLCTAKLIRRYFLEGIAPAASHSVCEVDELPFGGDPERVETLSQEDEELLELWKSTEGLVAGLGM